MKKIIFTVLEVGNKIEFDLLFVNHGFSGIKIEKSYRYYVNSLDAFYHSDYSDIISVIQKQIAQAKFNRVPTTVILASDQIFLERLTLPILSTSETNKTFNLELKKTYGDIENKFVASSVVSKFDKHNKLFKVAFYKLNKFEYLIKFIKKLGLSPGKVLIRPEIIKSALVKNNALDLKKNVIVVNVGERATDLVVFKNGKIDGFMIVNEGMDNIDTLIADSYGVSLAEAEEKRLNDSEFKSVGKFGTIYDFFEEGLETVIFRIKTIIGAYYENQKIDYVLINSEKNSEEYIQEMLERKLKMDIQKLKISNQKMKRNLNLCALFTKTVNNKNFYF